MTLTPQARATGGKSFRPTQLTGRRQHRHYSKSMASPYLQIGDNFQPYVWPHDLGGIREKEPQSKELALRRGVL